jgi:hypothetical protein
MDSRGAAAVLRARRLARSLGGNLTLVGPSAPAALVLRAVLPDQDLAPPGRTAAAPRSRHPHPLG